VQAAGYTVELDVRDWAPGQDFVARMQQALRQADRMLAVWSDAYFASPFASAEFRAAFIHQAQTGRHILPVLVEQASVPELYAPLIYLDLVGLDEATAITQLREALAEAKPSPLPPRYPRERSQWVQGPPSFAGQFPTLWRVPPRNPHFTGRDETLLLLRQRLRAEEGTRAVQALYGMGGVGKTQLSIEYAHRFSADYDLVWWIDAGQPVLIPDQLTRLASRLNIVEPTVTDTVDRLLAALRRASRWLLIYDNAERPELLLDYLPEGAGHVLVTSRRPDWGALGGRLEVDVLARAETLTLLRRRIPELDVSLGEELAVELGDLPLAVEQAGAYLEQTALPAFDYLRRFRAQRNSMLERGNVLGYHGRLDTAWLMSLERLRRDNPTAVQLLQIGAFLAPEPIPLELFVRHPQVVDGPLAAVAADSDALDDIVGSIVSFSLARRRSGGFQLHRLVQAAIRHHLAPAQQERIVDQVLTLLAAAFPGTPSDPTSWSAYAMIAPHVLATSALGDERADSRQLMIGTIGYLNITGDGKVSQELGKGVLARWRERIGHDHPATLTLAADLCFALAWTGAAEEGRVLGEDTLERCRRVLGPDHPATLASAANLGFAFAWLGAVEEAQALGRDTLERHRRVLGADHASTLTFATNQTLIMTWLGAAEEASVLGRDTLERCRRVLGIDHPASLGSAANLGLALAWLGAAEEARTLGRDTLERCRRVLGTNHPATLRSMAALTLALAWSGAAADEARTLGDDTLERCRRVLGANHPSTLHSAAAVTLALALLSATAEAVPLGQATLDSCRRVLGANHPATLRSAAALTIALALASAIEEAQALGRDTLERYRDVLGAGNLDSRRLAHLLDQLVMIEVQPPEERLCYLEFQEVRDKLGLRPGLDPGAPK
jgi:hypothetical protein